MTRAIALDFFYIFFLNLQKTIGLHLIVGCHPISGGYFNSERLFRFWCSSRDGRDSFNNASWGCSNKAGVYFTTPFSPTDMDVGCVKAKVFGFISTNLPFLYNRSNFCSAMDALKRIEILRYG